MRKIFLLTNLYPSAENPSRGIFVQRMERQLLETGFSLKIIKYRPPCKKSIFKKFFRYISFYLSCIFNILFKNPDVIYVHFASHCSVPVLISKLLRDKFGKETKIITNVHGSDIVIPKRHGWRDKVKIILAAALLKRSTIIISPSKSFMREVRPLINYDTSIKLIDVPSGGVDTNIYNSQDRREGYKGRILFLARMENVKRPVYTVSELLNLYRMYSSSIDSISVVGTGSKSIEVERLIRESGSDTIRYLGAVSNEEVPTLYNGNDIYVLLSSSESLGLTVLEAMACGMIVFVSDIPVFRDYIEHGVNGFIVSSEFSLSDCFSCYLNLSDSERFELSNNAIDTVLRNYSNRISSKRLISVFKNL